MARSTGPLPRKRRTGSRPFAGLAAGVLMLMIIVACTPAASEPTRVPPTEPPFITVIVTLTPTSTPTLTPTPTLPYDITLFLGSWHLETLYSLRGDSPFNHVQFVGSANLEVDSTGHLTGSIEFFPAVQQPPCVASVLDSEPITAQISGALRPAPKGGVVADLVFQPDNLAQETGLRLFCPEFTEAYEMRTALLWPALIATSDLKLALPLQVGYRQILTADLTGPTGGGLRGLFVSEILISR